MPAEGGSSRQRLQGDLRKAGRATDLDGVNGRDRHPAGSDTREHVTADLEGSHGKDTSKERFGGLPQGAELERWSRVDEAVERDDGELYEGKGDRELENHEDRLARVGREC